MGACIEPYTRAWAWLCCWPLVGVVYVSSTQQLPGSLNPSMWAAAAWWTAVVLMYVYVTKDREHCISASNLSLAATYVPPIPFRKPIVNASVQSARHASRNSGSQKLHHNSSDHGSVYYSRQYRTDWVDWLCMHLWGARGARSAGGGGQ